MVSSMRIYDRGTESHSKKIQHSVPEKNAAALKNLSSEMLLWHNAPIFFSACRSCCMRTSFCCTMKALMKALAGSVRPCSGFFVRESILVLHCPDLATTPIPQANKVQGGLRKKKAGLQALIAQKKGRQGACSGPCGSSLASP